MLAAPLPGKKGPYGYLYLPEAFARGSLMCLYDDHGLTLPLLPGTPVYRLLRCPTPLGRSASNFAVGADIAAVAAAAPQPQLLLSAFPPLLSAASPRNIASVVSMSAATAFVVAVHAIAALAAFHNAAFAPVSYTQRRPLLFLFLRW